MYVYNRTKWPGQIQQQQSKIGLGSFSFVLFKLISVSHGQHPWRFLSFSLSLSLRAAW